MGAVEGPPCKWPRRIFRSRPSLLCPAPACIGCPARLPSMNMSFLDQLRNLVQQLARGHERRTVVIFSDGFQPMPGKQAYDMLAGYFPSFRSL
jgi:hypothetical protein